MKANRIFRLVDDHRLNQLYYHWAKMRRLTQDSWPALFNTKNNQRNVKHRTKVEAHFQLMLRRKIGDVQWKLIDVKELKSIVAVWVEED